MAIRSDEDTRKLKDVIEKLHEALDACYEALGGADDRSRELARKRRGAANAN